MKIFQDLRQWQKQRQEIEGNLRLGLVTTMGVLHKGHASLIERSKQENDRSIVSIFVNPTQFNRPEDLLHYPRNFSQDCALLQELGVDYCLHPSYEDLYPDDYTISIQENDISQSMEGICRPGHFNGMLTVVLKLLQVTAAHQAYFGEKDYQQYLLVKKMAQAFFLPVNIHACATIREEDGLPYSSRNNRLDPVQREKAGHFAKIFLQKEKSLQTIEKELLEDNISVEYLREYEGRRFAAVFMDAIRLIDNYPILGNI